LINRCAFPIISDPARFGSVRIACLTLFQVSTLASWTSIAYTSWWGCSNYGGSAYAGADDDPRSRIHTEFWSSQFESYKCKSAIILLCFSYFALFYFFEYITSRDRPGDRHHISCNYIFFLLLLHSYYGLGRHGKALATFFSHFFF
jgi:hypothetical protein